MKMKSSYNGNLILTPYREVKELKEKSINRGLVGVENKIGIKSLELLVDAYIFLGDNSRRVEKGSKIFFKEETLHSQQWPRKIFESEDFPEGFVIGSVNDIIFIEES